MGCRDDKLLALASGVISTHFNYTFFKIIENYSVKVLINVIVFLLRQSLTVYTRLNQNLPSVLLPQPLNC